MTAKEAFELSISNTKMNEIYMQIKTMSEQNEFELHWSGHLTDGQKYTLINNGYQLSENTKAGETIISWNIEKR